MSESLKGKSLLSMADLSKEQIYNILKTAEILKLQLKSGQPHPLLQGKVLGMIFEKPSTRTRVSFEVAMLQLGGHGLYLSSKDLQLGRGETVQDSAIVLGRYLDGIMARVFKHETVATLAQYSGVPVINGLSDLEHPCQILGDFLTVYEKKGGLEGLKLAFIGDGNNVCHSLLLGCAKMGMHISVAHPKGFAPDKTLVKQAKALAGSKIHIEIGNDAKLAVKNADVIYTDVWTSMGQETEQEKRKKEFAAYQVNAKLLSAAHPETIVMHCLPAHRGEEITNEVMDGPHSVVFDEAENRLHAQKAVLALLMK